MIIPYQQISPDALQALIEEFITRDGTDYGVVEISLAEKTRQVMQQIKSNQVLIVFDAQTETVTLIQQHEAQQLGLLNS